MSNLTEKNNHQEKDILQFIPQRPPFVMVDRIIEEGSDYLITSFDVKNENVLSENGYFNEGGLVENIAQTAAIFAGLQFKANGKETPLGFIASIRGLEIENLAQCNTTITTKIRLTSDIMNIQVVEGEVLDQENKKLASCELRIFIKTD